MKIGQYIKWNWNDKKKQSKLCLDCDCSPALDKKKKNLGASYIWIPGQKKEKQNKKWSKVKSSFGRSNIQQFVVITRKCKIMIPTK